MLAITQTQLIDAAARHSGLSMAVMLRAYRALSSEIVTALHKGHAIRFSGIGTLRVKAHTVRRIQEKWLPTSSRPIADYVRYRVCFRPAASLRASLRQTGAVPVDDLSRDA